MLLDGDVGASPSTFSLDRDPLCRPAPAPPSSTRSRHSTNRRAPSSAKTIDDMVRSCEPTLNHPKCILVTLGEEIRKSKATFADF